MSVSNRIRLFVAICAASAAGLVWILWNNAPQTQPQAPPPVAETPATPATTPVATVPLEAPKSGPASQRIYFRSTNPQSHYGELAYVEYPDLKSHYRDQWYCEVVYVAGGKGSCLTADRGVITTYAADIFDDTFHKKFNLALTGIPSRTRVSPNGKLAAVTVFVTGHGYDSVDFTTQTSLIDTSTGKIVSDLESFSVSKDGRNFTAKDFNFWGVTFAPDSDRFYATLSSNRKHYLIQEGAHGACDLRERRMSVDLARCDARGV